MARIYSRGFTTWNIDVASSYVQVPFDSSRRDGVGAKAVSQSGPTTRNFTNLPSVPNGVGFIPLDKNDHMRAALDVGHGAAVSSQQLADRARGVG